MMEIKDVAVMKVMLVPVQDEVVKDIMTSAYNNMHILKQVALKLVNYLHRYTIRYFT